MKTVNFTEMKSGTEDEYLLLDKYEKEYIDGTADRILDFMKNLNSTLEGYKISRLEQQLELLMTKLMKRWSLQLYYMILEMN
jgi:hypothetical protein